MNIVFFKIIALSFIFVGSFFMPFSYADNATVYNLTDAGGAAQIGLKSAEVLKGALDVKKSLYKKEPVKRVQNANGLKQTKAVGKHSRRKANKYSSSAVKRRSKKNPKVAYSNDEKIVNLESQLDKLKKDNRFYKTQLKYKEDESKIREKELERLGKKLKLEKKLYLAEIKRKEEGFASLKSGYESRMRVMKNEIDKLAQEQSSLLVEKIKIESRQSARMEELMRIKNDLDSIIEFYP